MFARIKNLFDQLKLVFVRLSREMKDCKKLGKQRTRNYIYIYIYIFYGANNSQASTQKYHITIQQKIFKNISQ